MNVFVSAVMSYTCKIAMPVGVLLSVTYRPTLFIGTRPKSIQDVTCHTAGVTCHPTQVNAPYLNPSQ